VDIQLEKIETRERKDREVCAETGAAQIGDDLLLNKEIEGWFESQPSELDKKQSEEDKKREAKKPKSHEGSQPKPGVGPGPLLTPVAAHGLTYKPASPPRFVPVVKPNIASLTAHVLTDEIQRMIQWRWQQQQQMQIQTLMQQNAIMQSPHQRTVYPQHQACHSMSPYSAHVQHYGAQRHVANGNRYQFPPPKNTPTRKESKEMQTREEKARPKKRGRPRKKKAPNSDDEWSESNSIDDDDDEEYVMPLSTRKGTKIKKPRRGRPPSSYPSTHQLRLRTQKIFFCSATKPHQQYTFKGVNCKKRYAHSALKI
jgi:hypothetical protein